MKLLATAVALTGTPTASTAAAEPKGAAKHKLWLYWTPGTSGNVLTVTIEIRPRTNTGATWVQELVWSSGSGAHTKTNESYTHTATGTSVVGLYVDLETAADEVQIKYSESDAGSATRGTITAYCQSSSR